MVSVNLRAVLRHDVDVSKASIPHPYASSFHGCMVPGQAQAEPSNNGNLCYIRRKANICVTIKALSLHQLGHSSRRSHVHMMTTRSHHSSDTELALSLGQQRTYRRQERRLQSIANATVLQGARGRAAQEVLGLQRVLGGSSRQVTPSDMGGALYGRFRFLQVVNRRKVGL